jgi:hypothetical protein
MPMPPRDGAWRSAPSAPAGRAWSCRRKLRGARNDDGSIDGGRGPPVVAGGRLLLSTPGEDFRVGGGPYTVAVSMADSSQVSAYLSRFRSAAVLRFEPYRRKFPTRRRCGGGVYQQVDPHGTGRYCDRALERSYRRRRHWSPRSNSVRRGRRREREPGTDWCGYRTAWSICAVANGFSASGDGQVMSRFGSIRERRRSAERGYTFVELLVVDDDPADPGFSGDASGAGDVSAPA